MSRQTIDAPPVQPPLYSLLIAADTPADGLRWQQGVQWAPEAHGQGGAITVDCFGGSPDKPLGTHPDINDADPFGIYADDHCTTLGSVERDFEGRARRQLAAVQSALIANEFQYGTLEGPAGGGTNAALVQAVQVAPGGPVDVALATLEQALAETFSGARCMIHVTTGTLVALASKFLVYQQPGTQKWLTIPGNVVAADAGYGPENADIFMYGTAMVSIRLSPVDLLPPTLAEATNRRTNLVEMRAERLALVLLDHTDQTPADLMFKVATDLTPWAAGS